MNVSERSVYSAMKVRRLAEEQGRPDIVAAVERGDMSINAALKELAAPSAPADGIGALRRAWKRASEAERLEFLRMIERGEV